MTTEAQKLALLEWAGWKHDFERQEGGHTCSSKTVWRLHGVEGDKPNLSSLDAIAEYEGKLSDEQKKVYAIHLHPKGVHHYLLADFLVATATAPQRLEALVRTLGLWKE